MTSDETHIIVGGGLAGAKAAETLRSEGFDGRVLIVGAEPERPYERPPLSKDYLRDPASREFIAFWMEDGRVTAAMNANVWDVNDAVERLIRERIRVEEKRLVGPEQPLEDLAAA